MVYIVLDVSLYHCFGIHDDDLLPSKQDHRLRLRCKRHFCKQLRNGLFDIVCGF